MITNLKTIALIVVIATPQLAFSSDVRFCNETSHDMDVASTYNYYYQWVTYWNENGWYNIKKGKCRDMQPVEADMHAGYVFSQIIDGKETYPLFEVNSNRKRPIEATHMCVKQGAPFMRGRMKPDQIGENCPENGVRYKFSFFITGGDNFVKLTFR